MRERISEKREGLSRQVSTYRYKALRLSTGSEQVVILVHGASGKECITHPGPSGTFG